MFFLKYTYVFWFLVSMKIAFSDSGTAGPKKHKAVFCSIKLPPCEKGKNAQDNCLDLDNIDLDLCSHLLIEATLDNDQMPALADNSDGSKITTKDILKLKHRKSNLKILTSIQLKHHSVVQSASTIYDNVIKLLSEYHLDGVHFNWPHDQLLKEKPTCENAFDFIEGFNNVRTSKSDNILLTASVQYDDLFTNCQKKSEQIIKSVDYLFISPSEYWDYVDETQPRLMIDVNKTISDYSNIFKENKHKLGLIIPFYGMKYANQQRKEKIYYKEICQLLKKSKWTKDLEKNFKTPYIAKNGEEIIYNDPQYATFMAKLAFDNEFGGVFIYSIDMDDRGGVCSGQRYPLLHAVHSVL